jgi:hypothetical protein
MNVHYSVDASVVTTVVFFAYRQIWYGGHLCGVLTEGSDISTGEA